MTDASDADLRRLAAPRSRSPCRSRSAPAPAPPRAATNDDPDADVTITFWHGWSAPTARSQAIQADVDAFEEANPNIHVKAVGNITDDKINQALRAGGPNAPDVVSSFTTDNVGQFCTSGAFVDLTPFMEKSGIDPADDLPAGAAASTRSTRATSARCRC